VITDLRYVQGTQMLSNNLGCEIHLLSSCHVAGRRLCKASHTGSGRVYNDEGERAVPCCKQTYLQVCCVINTLLRCWLSAFNAMTQVYD
jgi:hypothetical protein